MTLYFIVNEWKLISNNEWKLISNPAHNKSATSIEKRSLHATLCARMSNL